MEQCGVGWQEFNGQIDGLSRTLEKLEMVDADLQIGRCISLLLSMKYQDVDFIFNYLLNS